MKIFITLLFSLFIFTSCNPKAYTATKMSLTSTKPEFQPNSNAFVWVEEKIDSVMKSNNIPALSAAIVLDGKLSYAAGFGSISRNNHSQVNASTVYQIGSDTKKLTAIIAKELILEKKLELDEPIGNHLSAALAGIAKEKLKNVTVKHLLLHRSGLPYRAPRDKRIDGDPMLIPYTEENLIKDLNEVKLETEPDSEFSYSNFGYAVMGYVLEKASGLDYSTLVKKYINDRYELANTFVEPDQHQEALIAIPYRKNDRTIKTAAFIMGKLTPAGGVYSTVLDQSKLMIAQIQAYRQFSQNTDKGDVLILTDQDGIQGSHYGYGLAKTLSDTGTLYGHGGDLDGFGSDYIFSPEHNVGFILLTSSGGRWIDQLTQEIMHKLILEAKTNDDFNGRP